MDVIFRYVQPTLNNRESNDMQLSSHQRVEDKNISKDAHLLGAGLDIQRDDILGYKK